MSRPLPEKALAIAKNVKVLVYSAIVLAITIITFAIWVGLSGGSSSGYKTQTINSMLGQQVIRTKGSSAQLCTGNKWVPIEKNGSQITIPEDTEIVVGAPASCSNSGGGGAPLFAKLILIIAAVLEAVTLALLFVAKGPRIAVKTKRDATA
jgi:hypothetical protein